MAWIYLSIAGLFEVAWAIGLKYTNGFTHLWWSLFTIVTMAISFGLLSLAMKVLPVGTAYAVWTGIGAVGAVILGIVLFGDSASFVRLTCIALIVCGIMGLKFESSLRRFLSPGDGAAVVQMQDTDPPPPGKDPGT